MPYDPAAIRTLVPLIATRTAQARLSKGKAIEDLRAFWSSEFDVAAWADRALESVQHKSQKTAGVARFTSETGKINRCELPGVEPERYALLSCDGSQIMPDRHASAIFAMIQSACVCITYGPENKADELIQVQAVAGLRKRATKLYSEDELMDRGELIGLSAISTERDIQEIELLAENCERLHRAGMKVVAIADGSLMPFALISERLPMSTAKQIANRIASALDRMRLCNAVVAGYVDRPNSNTLVKALALGIYGETQVGGALDVVESLVDRQVVEGVLAPSQRTSCFDPGWNAAGIRYVANAGHGLMACYANMSRNPTRPYIARIEIPVWCAAELPNLHMILQRQSMASIGDPYPFCLKAAHESAVITKEDQREIQQAIERALLTLGIVPSTSAKQSAKELH